MKTDVRETEELEDLTDESDDYSGHSGDEPKRSPMRRKEKFRSADFRTKKKPKDQKRSHRNNMKYDFNL